MCDIIIDNESTYNLIALNAIKKLELKVEKHPRPHSVSWIQSGDSFSVDKRSKVPLSIGRRYKDEIICDVINMDVTLTHVFLGRH